MPSRWSISPSASPSGAASRPSTCAAMSVMTTSPAKPAHDLAHLHSDRPGTQYQQAARDCFHGGRVAAAPDSLQVAQSRDGRDDRIGAVGQDDVIGRVAHAVDVDDTRTGQPAGAAQQVDLVLGQPAHLTGVGVVRDLEVTPGEHRLDVHLGTRGGIVRPVHRLAGRSNVFEGMHAQ